MRAMALALILSGCSFQVDGVSVSWSDLGPADLPDLAVPVFDLAARDQRGDDLTPLPSGDLSTPAELGPADLALADFAVPHDLTVLDDLTILRDLTPPPDLTPVITLTVSHVAQHHLTDGNCDLTVATSIDTTNLQIDGAAVPSGCTFTSEMENGTLSVAVLSVKSLVVSGSVTVSGSRPLVVVAGTTIDISGTLDGSANHTVAGPGGSGGHAGAGRGGNGSHATATFADSGGGGAGATVNGAVGGIGSLGGTAAGGTAGPMSSDTTLSLTVPGGSGGGNISSEGCTVTNGGGGAGGGSIQLSAGTSLTVTGIINVAGGGGLGGCLMGAFNEGSGGGGGSGGSIFLESRAVTVSGGLWANGGGGGGGASGGGAAGGNGGNGQTSTTVASVGASGGGFGGVGGAGGTATAPVKGGDAANGGGGGGSAGLIVVRSHSSVTVSNTSPGAQIQSISP